MSEFEFNLDRGKRLLTVVMRGFWDVRIYQAYLGVCFADVDDGD